MNNTVDERSEVIKPVTTVTSSVDNARRDENGMTSDEIFDQLADDDHVTTSGRGSRLPLVDSTDDTAATGYSAGIGSGNGAD